MRQALLVSAMVFLIFASLAKDQAIAAQAPFPFEWVPSGEVMYKQYCAACHGANAKGNGPAASNFKTRPADLTTLPIAGNPVSQDSAPLPVPFARSPLD